MREAPLAEGTDPLLLAVGGGIELFDLGRPMFVGMPQSPNHPKFCLALQRRHGDSVRGDGSSAANDLIVTGGHVGTHLDALCHVSAEGTLYGGVDAGSAQLGGRFSELGVETVPPFFCRGLLVDVPAALGVDRCEPGYEITPSDLELASKDLVPAPGDVVLVRTGWGQNFHDAESYIGYESGVPGPGEAAAHWLAATGARAVGDDTIAFERLVPGAGHASLPAHRVLLVERGVHIIEMLDLEGLAAAGIHEFLFVLAPLKLVGATGSPARPLAVVSSVLQPEAGMRPEMRKLKEE